MASLKSHTIADYIKAGHQDYLMRRKSCTLQHIGKTRTGFQMVAYRYDSETKKQITEAFD